MYQTKKKNKKKTKKKTQKKKQTKKQLLAPDQKLHSWATVFAHACLSNYIW